MNKYEKSVKFRLILFLGVGGHCHSDAECTIENSFCANKTCICSDNYVGNKNFDKCLPVVHMYNGSCTENGQCFQIAGICTSGSCICDLNFHYVEGFKCFRSRFINEPCTSLGNCTVKNSICLKGFCQCDYGFRSVNSGARCSGAEQISRLSMILFLLNTCIIFKSN